MRLAIYHHLPSGGALYHLHQVVTELSKRGHELVLFTPSTAEQDFLNLDALVQEHRVFPRNSFEPGSSLTNPIRYRTFLEQSMASDRAIAEAIRSGGFDGVYLGQCRTWTEPPLLRFLPTSITTVLYCQEPKRTFHEQRFLEERARWPWWKKAWRLPTVHWMKNAMDLNIRRATKVYCNSRFSRGRIANAYPDLEAQVQYIGVDTELFQPDPKPIHSSREIISVGALDPSKGHSMSLRVAGSQPGGSPWKVNIVTDRSYGSHAEELVDLANTLGVELEFHERVSSESLAELYRRSFACVYFPIEEPFGIVSCESQACGTPVLGMDEGGIQETLQEGGQRCARDVDAARAILEQWLEDPSGYGKLCTKARENALENWNRETLIARTVDDLEACFQSL